MSSRISRSTRNSLRISASAVVEPGGLKPFEQDVGAFGVDAVAAPDRGYGVNSSSAPDVVADVGRCVWDSGHRRPRGADDTRPGGRAPCAPHSRQGLARARYADGYAVARTRGTGGTRLRAGHADTGLSGSVGAAQTGSLVVDRPHDIRGYINKCANGGPREAGAARFGDLVPEELELALQPPLERRDRRHRVGPCDLSKPLSAAFARRPRRHPRRPPITRSGAMTCTHTRVLPRSVVANRTSMRRPRSVRS
jgi:hypothetical protein